MRLLVLLMCAAACGDNQDPCDYHEADDVNNGASPEVTGMAIAGGRARAVCGSIDGGHFDGATQELDQDRYRVTVGGSGELLVQAVADPDIALLGEVDVRVFDAHEILVGEGALRPDLAGHLAFVATVPPGDVDVVVAAHAANDIDGALAYRVRLVPDPSASCPRAGFAPQDRESGDGADDRGNDVVGVNFAAAMPFAQTGGTPEGTQLAIEAGASYRVSGAAAAEARGDQYLDRDTYAITTSDYATELAVRLDWDGDAGADLDYVVFTGDGSRTAVAQSTLASTSGPEFQVFAVEPRTAYWLWIGRFAARDAGPPAVSYDATICGGGFF